MNTLLNNTNRLLNINSGHPVTHAAIAPAHGATSPLDATVPPPDISVAVPSPLEQTKDLMEEKIKAVAAKMDDKFQGLSDQMKEFMGTIGKYIENITDQPSTPKRSANDSDVGESSSGDPGGASGDADKVKTADEPATEARGRKRAAKKAKSE